MDELSQRLAELSPAKRAILQLRLEQRNRARAGTLAIPPRLERNSAPASFAQERLWFLSQLEPTHSVYNISRVIHLDGPLSVAALELALREIVSRHEALRTSFVWTGESLRQLIDGNLSIPLTLIDLSELDETQRTERAKLLTKQDLEQPFNLSTGPIIRTTLLRLTDDEHILSLVTHHIVSDAWSAAILFNELEQLYEAFADEKPSPLRPLSVQYPDFAEWQRERLQGSTLASLLSYWNEKLTDAPLTLDVPTDRPRPPAQTFRGSHRSLSISRDLTDQLNSLSRREGATLFMTLLAAFQVLLCRYSRQYDIVVGSPISGRNMSEIEDLLGVFINTLVLRADLTGNPTFKELLAQVRDTALEAYEHQDLPFEKLVEELQPQRDLGRSPIVQVMFQLQNAPRSARTLKGLKVRTIQVERESAKFDLFLTAREVDGALNLSMEYSTDLFDGVTIDRMLGHYENLLKSFVADSEIRVLNAPLVTHLEERQILTDWNDTLVEFPDLCIHQIFEERASRNPDEVAVVCEDGRLTNRELNARANQLAHHLLKLGVKRETRVGIYLNRSLEMVISLLGILKAGAAYVPLDPVFPSDRLAFMIEDSDLSVLLTQKSLHADLPSHHTTVVELDTEWDSICQNSQENPVTKSTTDNLAYVIYTSGSTGTPKGVEIGHRALTNFLFSVQKEPGLAPDDVLVAVTTLSFDIAGLEIYLPLMTGARLVIVNREVAADGIQLKQKIADCGATVMQATPATWQMLIDAGWEGQRGLKVLCGGEALSRELANELLARGMTVWNMYGPTETTIWSTTCKLSPGSGTISIGRPIANTQIYLLDEKQQPVPIGVAGELHIGGDGLARGYLKRPELTAEKFIPNHFSDERNARLYKTGDLARYLANGDIEYLGRLDNQVKIRGYRIELGEIESVLRQHESVGEAVVTAHEDESGDRRLVAYVIADRKERDTAPEDYWAGLVSDLRRHLRQHLPEYMVPAMYVELSQLPLTANGKVDRRALPSPDTARPEQEEEFVAPRTATEEKLASIWTEVLKIDRVGINDNFFHLGGHSLLATQVIGRIRNSLQIELPLRAFFEAPTIKSLSEKLHSMTPITKPVAVPALKSRRRSALSIEQLSPEEVDSLLLKVLSETDR